ncbi:MAG: insulinase family protein [Bacteroidetes bacterium]|nr:insulinase family protein [Bacteroidota bacterium]
MKKIRVILFTLMLTGLLSVNANAQKYDIYSKTLDNGLDVIVIHNPAVPLITVEIVVKNGSYTEPPEYDGLSHLYEHMFFKANKTIPNQKRYMERLNELGARWNGTTSTERVNYFFTVPKDSVEPAMVFMYNAITGPVFKQEELVNERPVVTGEYDRNESNPFFHLVRAVNKKVWWKYYSRKNVIGDRKIIMTATTKKMQTVQDRFYIPNNSALILSGDITPEYGFKLGEKIFSKWKRGKDPFSYLKIPKHPPIKKTETVVVEKPVNIVGIYIVWQGPNVSEDPQATYAADVLSFILGQKTSKFYKNIIESGLAFGINFGYNTLNHGGPISVFVQTSPQNYKKCEKAIFDEIKKMTSKDYFTDEQLENAKTILSIDDQYGRERPSQFVHTVSYWWAIASLDYYLNYIDNLQKVTRDDINNYLNNYVIGKKHVGGVLVSPQVKTKLGL